MALQVDSVSLEKRPGILMVGSSNVGKRSLLSRLLSIDFEDASDLSAEVLCHGWTIDTKYYTADVSIWMAHLDDAFSISALPISNNLAALVMVFDMNDLSSFTTLQDWVSHTDIQKFDILLCIGNKADLLPGHFAHAEYRRYLQRHGESFGDPHPEFLDYGILESEGSSLLGDEEPSWEIRRSCLEWCSQYNIEYIEACASNTAFDKCLSVDGDSQGVERLYAALSAHMWPGMVLKSGNTISQPYAPEKEEESSEDEPDYEIEYEILSHGSAEPWDDTEEVWVSANGTTSAVDARGDLGSTSEIVTIKNLEQENEISGNLGTDQPSTSRAPVQEEFKASMVEKSCDPNKAIELDEDDAHLGFEDLEQLMNEIGNMRGSLRLMPDFQRKEMAGKLAMKMAAMFGDSSGDEEGFV
ncbi:Small GTPase superfamily [Macleaya cordata]|uniref:Small GTPase superfamily n=1 Tax=Macleaya cordata TaxID=56857 RepID=A0A200PTB8_MACCD|nr:Small GTPase superfamily [Macleaya cordata]